ncbi:MAG: threonine ammonia-lyase [Phycisphaerae bacterium]|nr:threonine ammonia-lyase [Phycisphaerae bacterium]
MGKVTDPNPLPTFDDVSAASSRIADGIFHTPCFEAPALSERCGCTVFTKDEHLQRTGSFKERGARNALMLLNKDAKKRGAIAASAGNHALALAHHGRELGIPITVCMPIHAPLVKQRRCELLGAKVIRHGQHILEARLAADERVVQDGLSYINGFDDPEVIAGQGTLGLEVISQVPQLDAVVIPVGGGGLLAGVGLAIKNLQPDVQLIGVEPTRAASLHAAWETGTPTSSEMQATLADGLAVPRVGDHAFQLIKKHVDQLVQVDEEAIAMSIFRLAEETKAVVEGAGATGLAALLNGSLPDLKGKRVVVPLCGGNIDPGMLGRVMDLGLVHDGRLVRFHAFIGDRPGGLSQLTDVIAAQGASVQQITHDRAFGITDFASVLVECTVETRDANHRDEVLKALTNEGIETRILEAIRPKAVPVGIGR